ncbi:C40 family peptidase [Bacillus massiliigorillae]|uniref:C40 family peptidase n=1 Tax=Bacillus massiliigorillae TaxID=1243664 RepID=UPI0003A8737B|nr:NlpC/P60 family protein [Bacillus massiliigorillae]
MKKSAMKKVAALSLSAALLLQAAPAFAAPVTTPSTTLATYNTQIEDLQTKIRKIDNDIIESMVKIQKLNTQVKEGQKRVEDSKVEIQKLEASLERSIELSKDRLQNIQMNGSVEFNLVEILLTSEGVSDFFQKTSAVLTIMESDKQLTDSLTKKDEELKEKKAKLDQELVTIKNRQEAATKEKAAIEKRKATIQTELKKVQEAKQKAEEEAKRIAEQQRREAAARAARAQRAESQPSQNQVENNQQSSSSNQNNSNNESTNKPSNTPVVNAPASGSASSVISIAKQYLGVPYVWGGTTPSGFDCSGFTSYVFRAVGVSLPRVSSAQQNVGTQVSTSSVQPGDLVFMGKPAYHVGIYIGGGQYIHAPQTGDVVKISSYNPSKFSSATRVLN